METHTFPLTEQDKHKLDDVTADLRNQTLLKQAHDYLRSNPACLWTACAVAAVAGCLVGRALSRD